MAFGEGKTKKCQQNQLIYLLGEWKLNLAIKDESSKKSEMFYLA